MSFVKSLKVAVAAVTLSAFLAPSLLVAPAAAAQSSKPAIAKKADQKTAKTAKTAKKHQVKKVAKASHKSVKKASAKKTAKKVPAKGTHA